MYITRRIILWTNVIKERLECELGRLRERNNNNNYDKTLCTGSQNNTKLNSKRAEGKKNENY